MQLMLQMFERRDISLALIRDHEAEDDTGQGGMDTGLEHRHPQHGTDQQVERQAIHAAAIHPEQQ